MRLHRFTSSDGVDLAFEEFGAGNAGTLLVLCHGIAVNGAQFHADAGWFADRGHRVLVPHLRGHGLSASPAPVTRASLGIARLAADLLEMLDTVNAPQVHWVGNSLGGIVALAMLKANRFASLATFGTSYSIILPQIGGPRFIALLHRVTGSQRAAAIAAHFTTPEPEARQLIDLMLRDARMDVVEALGTNLSHYDLIAEGTAASLPILMLRCGRDRLVNLALRDTLRAMQSKPNFRLVDLPGGGHAANLDVPEALRMALLDFWGSLPG